MTTKLLSKNEAIKIIDNLSTDNVYLIRYNSTDGISSKGELIDKNKVYKWIDQATLIQFIDDIIIKMEIFNETEIVLQLLLT